MLALALLPLAAPALAQQPADRPAERVIRVTGTGEVRVAPDVAHIDLAVETAVRTARAAGEENARVMDRLIRALTAAGVARNDIQTRGYTLFPEYAPQPPPRPLPADTVTPDRPRIVGYRATNVVTVRTSDLARVGTLIDTALGAGANRMHGLRFSLQDPEAARNRALTAATERARRSAEAVAAALGVQLGPVVEASTEAGVVGPFVQYDRRMVSAEAGMAAPTPVEPGEQTISASVVVVYAIGAAR